MTLGPPEPLQARPLWFTSIPQRCNGCGYVRAFALYRYGEHALPVCEPCAEGLR